MSLETLLTIGLAGVIVAAVSILWLVAKLGVRTVRVLSGRPARRPQPESDTAGPSRLGRGFGHVVDGLSALGAFIAATATTWWRKTVHPSLLEAQEAAIAGITEHPESTGQTELLVRVSPIAVEDGSAPEEAAPDMQVV